VLDRAVAHADEHVIKFTETAAEVYTRTGHPDALAAAPPCRHAHPAQHLTPAGLGSISEGVPPRLSIWRSVVRVEGE
jgi:hypothetical protein